MQKNIADEISDILRLVRDNPESAAALKALVLLLEDAPDGALVVKALEDVDPSACKDADLRARVRRLLERADAFRIATRWEEQAEAAGPLSNVVPLAGAARGPASGANLPFRVAFDDIGGLEQVKVQIRRKIIAPFLNQGLFQKFRRKAGGGILLFGPPGCGKTMIARAIATECKATFTEVRAAEILDPYTGVAEQRAQAVFEQARSNPPAVLFFDEMEALTHHRQFAAHGAVNTLISVLLNEMDGLNGRNEGLLFLGATNVPWAIDTAFRRPGRFDRAIFVPPPDRHARGYILARLLANRPVAANLDRELIVKKTPGYSGADLNALVETAVDFAIEESEGADSLTPISNEHFKAALEEVRPSTGEWLSQARNFAEYANRDGIYDDLRDFLRKYAR